MKSNGVDRRSFLALGIGALGVATAPAWLRPRERMVRLTIPVMGTVGELAVPARSEGAARQALAAAAAELRRVEALMTRFRPDSDVGRFNVAGAGERVPVSPETAEVVRAALACAERSGGGFDPTLERLTHLWDPARNQAPPPEAALEAARLAAGGWRELEVTTPAGTDGASLRRGASTALDLGGIAKGYGVDRAAAVLRDHGVFRGLVNVGGDLVALGEGPGGRPWRIGVRDPRDPSGVLETVEVVDEAVATSGDYLRFFRYGGRRYHHILDPATGEPTRSRLRTVTVSAEDALSADAAATTVFAMGVEGASRILASAPGSVRIIHHG
ncbi:MAG: FAD:protein FMN transferase [Longimicrobiales bacterium]|nr:FAD:protein FMN transferase [Longimicrobiales bacterium]